MVFPTLLAVARIVVCEMRVAGILPYESYSNQYLIGFFGHQFRIKIRTDRKRLLSVFGKARLFCSPKCEGLLFPEFFCYGPCRDSQSPPFILTKPAFDFSHFAIFVTRSLLASELIDPAHRQNTAAHIIFLWSGQVLT